MTQIDSHPPGSFCWIELCTTDQPAAKSFYQSLFGWTPNDMPIGPNDFYTIFRLEGRDAAAAYTLRPDQRSQGVPPHWMLYMMVTSADDAAKRAVEVGGTVIVQPFDVFDAGRMAVLQDPTGAVFAVWEPKRSQGTGIAQIDGTLCWADLSTPDPERAGKFYSDLFGWQIVADDEDPEHGYLHIKNGEHFIGGIPPVSHRQPGIPPHWLPYFNASNCDATADKAKQLGAKFYLPPMTTENVGRMAVIADPQGAVFALFQHMPREQK
ncbi:MAG: VOC family protein [Candidatus Korobacteraceae bacterium]